MYDIRDNNAYTVRKLADGNCWMTQNLYLAKTMTLTSANSNVTSDYAITRIYGNASMSNGGAYDRGNATYGAYYTWNTAVAGGNGDICPKNWRLPNGGSAGDFWVLYAYSYNSAAAFQSNVGPEFVIGARRNGTVFDDTDRGYYWTNAAYNSSDGYCMFFNNSQVWSVNNKSKGLGMNIRCLAK